MTLLEAISPTSRAVLNYGIVKGPNCKIHARREDGQPVCGGGRLARLVNQWQADIGGINCTACLTIINRRNRHES